MPNIMKLIAPLIVAATCTAAPVLAQDAGGTYPVVFDSNAGLAAFGIQIRGIGPDPDAPAFANKCYYYGDGGTLMSISDEIVRAYAPKGFSLQTLCMGMLAGIRFDPDTGRRLATIMRADVEAIRTNGYAEPWTASPEVGLEVPACFARGRPMSDCDFRYDPKSGQALTEQTRTALKQIGEKTDATGREALASGRYTRECGLDEIGEECRIEVYPDTPDNMYVKGYLAREWSVTGLDWPVGFMDVSPVFADGFAYSILTDGAAGPSAELGAEKIAVDPKRRATEAVLQSLRLKLK